MVILRELQNAGFFGNIIECCDIDGWLYLQAMNGAGLGIVLNVDVNP